MAGLKKSGSRLGVVIRQYGGVFLVWAGIVAITGILTGGVFLLYILRNLPSLEEITSRQVAQSTKIYDRTGRVLLYEIGANQKRTVVPLAEIPGFLKDATVAIEDERFYQSGTLDIQSLLRATMVNIKNGGFVQGASTITQQLAKNAFLSPERTITRKLKEFVLAIQLNRHYSKDKILELYLNEISYGSTTYGVEAAAQAYFGQPVRELDLAQSALLAALPKAPSYYSPWGSHQQELLNRQRVILEKMLELGKITAAEKTAAAQEKLIFHPQSNSIKAPHFVLMVQDYLTQKYGDSLVQRGGLNIITTLDWDLQQIAEEAVVVGATQNEELYRGKNASLVAEDPKTGQVLVLVGSRDYFDIKNEGNFNVAAQGLRQPGSTLKPFAYMTLFEKGFAPQSLVVDAPTEFAANNPACPAEVNFNNENPLCFHPQNFDDTFRGPVSLRTALAQSINVPAVKVLYLAGLQNVLSTANALGLKTLSNANQYGLSLVLGGGAVHLTDLVQAYSVLAQDGASHTQSLILEVRDNSGKILESFMDSPKQIIDPQYPRLVNNILSDINARAGLFHSSLSLTIIPGFDVALKTGTSNDYRDAWTVGYTPFLVAGVWAGNNDNSPMQRHGSSILAAVPIWNSFMAAAVKKYSPEFFIPPAEQLVINKPMLSGVLPADGSLHSILYYVNRDDIAGIIPNKPWQDPQFLNWEVGVQKWSNKNNLSSAANNTTGGVQVVIQQPGVGSFIENKLIPFSAVIASLSPITTVRLYFNGDMVFESQDQFPGNYTLQTNIAPFKVLSQNFIEIEVVNKNGDQKKTGVIVYGE